MLTEKTTSTNNDPLGSTWSNNTVHIGDHVHESQRWQEAGATTNADVITESSFVLVPSGCRIANNNMENLNSNVSCPHASAVLLSEHLQEESNSLTTVEHPHPVLVAVEVDAVSGRIRFELEPTKNSTRTVLPSPETPRSNLSYTQKSWLIVFVRKWARKTIAMSGKAATTYTPMVKGGVKRSVRVIKDASIQSASFVQKVSRKCKDRVVELNQKQDIGPRAQSSMKRVGKSFKQASTTAACGMQKASVATARGLKELEEKHHIMRKSKRSVKKGGNIIRNIWNGKKPIPHDSAGVTEPTMFVVDREPQEHQYNVPRPSSE